MARTVEGVYRKGRVELSEQPRDLKDDSLVLVLIPGDDAMDLRERGIDRSQAADLRHRLAAFAEDWESPEMSVYDRYGT
jgi:hypothetical protein